MVIRYTEENIKEFISQTDCKLVSIEKRKYTYLNLVCKCGTSFTTTLGDFKNKDKKQCNKCGKKNMADKQKFSFEYVKNYIENTGYKLLSDEYKNANEPLELICFNGHKYTTKFSDFKNGIRCKICSRHFKDTKMYKEEVNMIHNGEFEVLEEYQKAAIPIKHRHKTCGYEFYAKPTNFLNRPGCPKCRNTHRWNDELIREKIFDMYGNEYELIENFKTVGKHHLFRHNICGNNYTVTISGFLSGYKCPYCNGKMKLTTEQYKLKVSNMSNDEYIVLGEYINSRTKILHKHVKCGNEFLMQPNSFINDEQRCPKCKTTSKGERKVTQWLDKNRVNYMPQFKFDDCKNKRPLPFDFAIFDENNQLYCLIEYDGEQHFKWRGHKITYEDFLQVQHHDNLKNQYCENNNIPLLRISYKNYKKINDILDKELNHLKNPFSEVIYIEWN